jgi:uncharacterized protein with FMN-binding domain
VALSSAAIVSVYAVGYAKTQSSENQLVQLASAAAPDAPSTAAPQVQQSSSDPAPRTGSSSGQQAGAPAPARASGSAAQSQQTTGYRDGTYVGVGNSRHGGIQATVVVSGGKITSASVTGCGTRYPCSKVTPLVNQVLTLQAAPMNYVSGATDSSQAYTQAVKNALAQAKAQAG